MVASSACTAAPGVAARPLRAAPARAASRAAPRARVAAAAAGPRSDEYLPLTTLSRRDALLGAGLAGTASWMGAESPALALVQPPLGFRYFNDELDGYNFFYPESWSQVTTSGNDIMFRNPFQLEENLFVDISSPSSSKYKSVTQIGTPQRTAEKLTKQILKEFMSTRLGLTRTSEVVSAEERSKGEDLYYDTLVRITSYASENQLAITPEQRQSAYGVEWDRYFYTVLGTANGRLYMLRMQCRSEDLDSVMPMFRQIGDSFGAYYVEPK